MKWVIGLNLEFQKEDNFEIKEEVSKRKKEFSLWLEKINSYQNYHSGTNFNVKPSIPVFFMSSSFVLCFRCKLELIIILIGVTAEYPFYQLPFLNHHC